MTYQSFSGRTRYKHSIALSCISYPEGPCSPGGDLNFSKADLMACLHHDYYLVMMIDVEVLCLSADTWSINLN